MLHTVVLVLSDPACFSTDHFVALERFVGSKLGQGFLKCTPLRAVNTQVVSVQLGKVFPLFFFN